MQTFQILLQFFKAVSELLDANQESKAQDLIRGIKSYPSLIGEKLQIEDSVKFEDLTPAQQDLNSYKFVDANSDLVDHIPSYDDEECKIVKNALFEVSKMTAQDVRSEKKIREKFYNLVDYNCISNCAWDFKKRDTVIQLKFSLEKEKPTRLVLAPLSKVQDTMIPILRHKGKPFQSLHMTSTKLESLIPYVGSSPTFILTIWVGNMENKITESGTGFRATGFPGQSLSKDNKARILFRNFTGDAFQQAIKDFRDTYDVVEDSDSIVPVLMQRDHFISLNK